MNTIAKDKPHLETLIEEHIKLYGNECDLNHIDISKWNFSQVIHMERAFASCPFNQDISSWNTSNVKDMTFMFAHSKFNQDISQWDTSNVKK